LTIHLCNAVLFLSLNISRNDILGTVGHLISQTDDSCVIWSTLSCASRAKTEYFTLD